jgi:hypothetical protein
MRSSRVLCWSGQIHDDRHDVIFIDRNSNITKAHVFEETLFSWTTIAMYLE